MLRDKIIEILVLADDFCIAFSGCFSQVPRRNIFCRLFGDKGYVSQALFNILATEGIRLTIKVIQNMK